MTDSFIDEAVDIMMDAKLMVDSIPLALIFLAPLKFFLLLSSL
uniref:Uncharacterized protein n=1 Tax=Manihot esculenta TaxID=3983 RepID=A0A2C9VVT4_MANES